MGSLTPSLVAVSAFCNAGFDNFGGDSMMSFQTDWLVNLTLSALIITGGLGFMVWFDLATKARNQIGTANSSLPYQGGSLVNSGDPSLWDSD